MLGAREHVVSKFLLRHSCVAAIDRMMIWHPLGCLEIRSTEEREEQRFLLPTSVLINSMLEKHHFLIFEHVRFVWELDLFWSLPLPARSLSASNQSFSSSSFSSSYTYATRVILAPCYVIFVHLRRSCSSLTRLKWRNTYHLTSIWPSYERGGRLPFKKNKKLTTTSPMNHTCFFLFFFFFFDWFKQQREQHYWHTSHFFVLLRALSSSSSSSSNSVSHSFQINISIYIVDDDDG